MKVFVKDIEERTEDNGDFRRVLHTGKFLQRVLMALKSGEEIHTDHDESFRIEKGRVADGCGCSPGLVQLSSRSFPWLGLDLGHNGPR